MGLRTKFQYINDVVLYGDQTTYQSVLRVKVLKTLSKSALHVKI